MRFRYWFKIHWKSLTFDRPSVGGLLLSISPFSIVSSLEEIWIKFKSVHRAMSVLIIVINKKLTLWILFSSLRRSQFCPFFVLLLLLLLWTPKSSSLASLNISIKLQLWGRIFSPSLSPLSLPDHLNEQTNIQSLTDLQSFFFVCSLEANFYSTSKAFGVPSILWKHFFGGDENDEDSSGRSTETLLVESSSLTRFVQSFSLSESFLIFSGEEKSQLNLFFWRTQMIIKMGK